MMQEARLDPIRCYVMIGGLTMGAEGATQFDIALGVLDGAAGGAISSVLPINPVLGTFVGTEIGAFLCAIGP